MGVYYYFFNLTQNKDNEKNVEGEFKHVMNMHYLDEDAMAVLFEDVIALNEWNKTDVIQAAPDYPEYPIIKYDSGEIMIINMQNLGVNPDRMEDNMESDEMSVTDDSSSESSVEEINMEVDPQDELINDPEITYDIDDYDATLPRRYPIVVDEALYPIVVDEILYPIISDDDDCWDQKEEDYDY